MPSSRNRDSEPHRSRSPQRSSESSRSATNNRSGSQIRKSSAYDANFKQHCLDCGIHATDQGQKPINQRSIRQEIATKLMASERPSSSQKDLEAIIEAIEDARTEADVIAGVLNPLIDGSGMILQRNVLFNGIAPLTDGSTKVYMPDAFDGSRPTDVDPRVREALGSYIMPSTNTATRCVPNIIIEVKGPLGHGSTGKLQVSWGGALAVRSIDKLNEWAFPGATPEAKASVFSILLNGAAGIGMMSIYMHYSVKTDTGLRYLMSPLKSFILTEDEDTLHEAKQTIKFVTQIAQRLRTEAIDAANTRARLCDASLPTISATISPFSETLSFSANKSARNSPSPTYSGSASSTGSRKRHRVNTPPRQGTKRDALRRRGNM